MRTNLVIALTALCASIACGQDDIKKEKTKTEAQPVNIIIETSLGNMHLTLDAEKAPITVSNFLAYVDQKFYDNTIFHRVIPNFMIQGGGFVVGMEQKKTNPPIKNEANNGLKNDRGTIAMARTAAPDSATSQFFINHRDNRALNRPNPDGHGYAVFGKVTEGLDVLDKIAEVQTGNSGMHQNVPIDPVIIKSIHRALVATAQ